MSDREKFLEQKMSYLEPEETEIEGRGKELEINAPVTGAVTIPSPVLNTGVSGTAIKDEDNMSSDSATHLATQQSIKAYVDSQVATEDTLAELNDTDISSPAGGHIVVYDGSNSWDNVAVSGDVTIATNGAVTIASGAVETGMLADDSVDADKLAANAVVNASVASSAAIADSKLATISTANKVSLTALDIDGGTDIGADIVDADLFIIDDGAGGTNKKVAASRIKTYAQGTGASQGFAIAMSICL